jgi:hypothetical protein
MDSFEKLMKRIYQEKKKEDEQSVPDFNSLVNRRHKPKQTGTLTVIWKLAASTAAAAIMAMLVWKAVDRGSSKKIAGTLNQELINHYAASSTDRLLHTGNGLTNIWDWKSPTDELLDPHHKYFNNKKISQ